MKNIIKVIIAAVLIFFIWFVWDGFIKDKTPTFFPINEKMGQYSIIKSQKGIFSVKYTGPNIYDNSNSISVIVGKTNYDLNKYIGKKIIITKGEFAGGHKKQCTAFFCIDIGGPYAVINIDELLVIQ